MYISVIVNFKIEILMKRNLLLCIDTRFINIDKCQPDYFALFQRIAFAEFIYQLSRLSVYPDGGKRGYITGLIHDYKFFIKKTIFIQLIIREIHFRLIITVINSYECNPLKPKALPRRARGKNRTCPVPSCFI